MKNNKKGVSLMVGYALLVVIAIALGALVYPYLKARLPAETVECPADLSISIEEAICNRADWTLSLVMLNRGLFNITGAYIRFADSSKSVRPQINKDKELYLSSGLRPAPLGPGQETRLLSYPIGSQSHLNENGTFVVEVQPAIFKKGVLVPCSNKIVTQTVECASSVIGWLYQETGNYSCEGQWDSFSPCDQAHDGDWSDTSFGTAAGGHEVFYYVNYTTPVGARWPETSWLVKYINGTTENISSFGQPPNPSCWNLTKMQFRVIINKSVSLPQNQWMSLSCKSNSGDWINLATETAGYPPKDLNLYEEKMQWQLRS